MQFTFHCPGIQSQFAEESQGTELPVVKHQRIPAFLSEDPVRQLYFGMYCRSKSYLLHLNSQVINSCPQIEANVHTEITSHFISLKMSSTQSTHYKFFHQKLGYCVTKLVDSLREIQSFFFFNIAVFEKKFCRLACIKFNG